MKLQNTILEVADLALQRGDNLLLKGVNFSLASGGAVELRGKNGTGKTTLLRAIAGLHQPVFGTIKITGHDEWENRDYISYIGHLDAIKANEKVESQLKFWAKLFNCDYAIAEKYIELLGVSRIMPLMGGGLSAGQRRRVAILRTIMCARPIWLLDEPFAPLDNDGRKILGDILDEHRNNGGMIIAAVHDAPFGMAMETLDIMQFIPQKVERGNANV